MSVECTTGAGPAAPLAYGVGLRDEVLTGFRGDVPPVAVPPLYRLGLTLVAAVMVLLPLAYLALAAGVGWAVWYHTVHDLGWMRSIRPAQVALVAYGGPIFIGATLVFFMVKPLFAPRARGPEPRSLDPAEEPVLFAFVERVAQVVGAPVPRRIDVDCQVNASASFRRGLWSLLGSDLVLTLGLPLVAGLSLEQLAGVLAHELGHFAQGAGMRLSFVVRSINGWFERVVFERDGWDESLEATTRERGWVALLAVVAVFMVKLTRKVLQGLMLAGHAVSCFLLRQMEYDADRYEARLVGSASFEATCRELGRLSLSHRKALSDLGDFWREGRLGDSVPALVAANRARLGGELLAKLDAHLASRATGVFDTHPADRDRIASARREGEGALFRSALPASALFRDWRSSSRAVSLDFYRQALGPGVAAESLHDAAELLRRKDAESLEAAARGRVFGGLANLLRGLPLPAEIPAAVELTSREERLERLRAGREALSTGDELANLVKRYDEADTAWMQALQADACTGHLAGSGPSGGGTLEPPQQIAQAQATMRALEPRLDELGALVVGRLIDALALREPVGEASAAASGETMGEAQVASLLAAAAAISTLFPTLIDLRNRHAIAAAVAGGLQRGGDGARLGRELQGAIDACAVLVLRVERALSAPRYPFAHARGDIRLAAYVVPEPVVATDLGAVFRLTGDVLQNAWGVYLRALGRLAAMAETAEAAAGLAPPANPPDAAA